MLTKFVKFMVGTRRKHHFKPKFCEERVPERQILIHIEPHRNTETPARPRFGRKTAQVFVFILICVVTAFRCFNTKRLFAFVSGDIAPSFCACLTDEFMNTVQREPRSTGCSANNPNFANSSAVYPSACAKVSINEPHPEEQASLSMILSMA